MKSGIYKVLLTLTATFFFSFSFFTDTCQAQWVQNSAIPGGSIHFLAASGSNVFAGASAYGVWHSVDDGSSWAPAGLYNVVWINGLATSGINTYALTTSGVYLSTDNGLNWSPGTLAHPVNTLVELGGKIFAGTDDNTGIFVSDNNGASWAQTSLNDKAIESMTTMGSNIFAGTRFYGVYLSTDTGASWTQTALNNQSVLSLAANSNTVFAGSSGHGIFYSSNYGASWVHDTLNHPYVYVYGIAVSGDFIFAGTDFGVYYSYNNGLSWALKNQGFTTIPVISSLLIANNFIFAGTLNNALWRWGLSGITAGVTDKEADANAAFSINPNPADGLITLHLDNFCGKDLVVEIYNAMGCLVKSECLAHNQQQIQTDDLINGLYVVTIKSTSISYSQRLIIQR